MKKTSAFFFVIVSSISFLLMDCKKEPLIVPPVPPKTEITLSLQDTTCIEAWLQLSFKNFTPPHNYKIYRDTTLSFAGILLTNDTTLIDTTLLPQRSYNYKVLRMENNVARDSSKILQVKTMDTTSHNITWTKYTIGEMGGNLYDVAIINDTFAIAVGEMYGKDSLGNYDFEKLYNAAIWNGKEWKLERFLYNYQGKLGAYTVRTIVAFSANDIWIGQGMHWDGKEWTYYSTAGIQDGVENEMWGSSSSNLFLVGYLGTIIKFNGVKWEKIETNTSLPIQDIWGGKNVFTNEEEIFCVASRTDQNEGKKILKVLDNTVSEVTDTSNLIWLLKGIWFAPGKQYYVAGAGIYTKKNIENNAVWKSYISGGASDYRSEKIRGTNINDVFVVGHFGEIVHFNGSTWKNYYNQTKLTAGIYRNVDMNKNFVIAVGFESSRAVAIVGKRNQ